MPLPNANEEWPPPSTRKARQLYRRWGAWYSGEPEELAKVYEDMPAIAGADVPAGNPAGGARFSSAIARGIQRMFWGAPPSTGQTRGHKLHIPLAGDIATTSSDLLFGEPPTFGIPKDAGAAGGPKTQARLDEILIESNAQATWMEGAEIAAAYGGVYHRVMWDPTVAEVPLFDVVPPDCAAPEFRSGRLVAVTLWRDLDRIDGRHWRHLERHERGRILHGVYRSSDENKLGQRMRLEDHPATAPFALLVDPGDRETVDTGADGLSIEYVPNMRPHRTLRGSPLGRSDYAGAEPMMDAFDEAWTSWMRDLRIGKGRLVVPRSYIQSRGRGQGGVFDPEREVYEQVEALDSGEGAMKLTVVQFAIRVEEHSRTCRELLLTTVRTAGYSGRTFGEDDQVAATATEVNAQIGRSVSTRRKKINYYTGPLARLAYAALQIDAAKFRPDGVTAIRPVLDWPDGLPDNTEDVARSLQMIKAAESASIETRVRRLNPDWDDKQVKAEVIKIKEEAGAAPVAEPGTAAASQPTEPVDAPEPEDDGEQRTG